MKNKKFFSTPNDKRSLNKTKRVNKNPKKLNDSRINGDVKHSNTRNIHNKNYRNTNNKYSNTRHKNNYEKRTKTKKTKTRNHSVLFKIFLIIMITAICSYFIVSIFKGLSKEPVEYDTIEYGKIDAGSQITGILIRDEKIYKASKDGVLEFEASESQKVKPNEIIVSIKNETDIAKVESDLKAINEQILNLQKQRGDLSLFSEEVKNIDNQIQEIVEYSMRDFMTLDMDAIHQIKEFVDKKITMKNQILLSENTGILKGLSKKKSEREITINNSIEIIKTKESGIVSYNIDGLEEEFTIKNKDKITKKQINNLKIDSEIQFKTMIKKGEPAFKIIKSNDYYIACYIENKYLKDWKVGDKKNIYVTKKGDNETIETEVKLIKKGEKESYVLLKSNQNMMDFINDRQITFITQLPKEGFKVQLSAIVKKELLKIPKDYVVQSKVIKKGAKTNEKLALQISDTDNDFVYIPINESILNIGDIILEPSTNKEYQVNEIFIAKGIYIVNTGLPTLKKIDTQESIKNDDFIILEPSKNKNIKLYDRYSPNVSADGVKIDDKQGAS